MLYPLSKSDNPSVAPKFGYIDTSGHVVIPYRFDEAGVFIQNRARVKIDGKYGLIDHHGDFVVPPKYTEVNAFSEGRAVVREGRLSGLIDEDGKEIVPPNYKWLSSFSDGLAIFSNFTLSAETQRFGAIDATGRVVIELIYAELQPFSNDRAAFRRDGKFGFLSKTGDIVVPAIYDFAGAFHDGYANVGVKRADGTGNLVGTIDVDGHVVVPIEFGWLSDFKNGRAMAADSHIAKTFHFIDRTGARISEDLAFDAYCIDRFTLAKLDGAMSIRKSPAGRCMYTDGDGAKKFGREFLYATPFVDGLAVVQVSAHESFGGPIRTQDKRFSGVIDAAGAFVVPPVYDAVQITMPGVISVHWEGRHGYLDRQGRPLTFEASVLNKYISEMKDAFNIVGHAGEHTIVGRAADIDYYFYLPSGLCALDRSVSVDAHLFKEVDDGIAAEQKRQRELVAGKHSETPSDDKFKLSVQQVAPGLFASCDQLRAFRSTGDRERLKWFGSATGSRTGRPDPSAGSGIVYIIRMMCGMARGTGAAGLSAEGPQQRTERIASAWAQVAKGQLATLPSIDNQLLGCTSAVLAPAEPAGVRARAITFGMISDWTLQIVRQEVVKSEAELEEVLKVQSSLLDAITKLNFRAQGRS